MATVASSGPGARAGPRGRSVLLKLLLVLFILALLFVAYCYIVLHWSYSSGEQAGWVQQLSYKGWICKTWEGEMAVVTMPGTTPEKFHFTIWDEKVAAEVNRLNGHRVALHYEEKVGIPSHCFGDTRFYVTAVRPVEEMLMAPSGTIPVAPGGASPSTPGGAGTSAPGPGGSPVAPGSASPSAVPGPPGAVAPGGTAPSVPLGAGSSMPGGASSGAATGTDRSGGQATGGGTRP